MKWDDVGSANLSTGFGHVVMAAIEKYKQFDEIFVTRAGCTISSHCGPNTLGILFVKK